ncbi:hypothetical protein F4780DRAFT_789418 [Xylariomycetidae sp. FL0641]|nr:hypothetical protein F4780DRAFT_789418 [Xylariomycetidae sp. FL0641]
MVLTLFGRQLRYHSPFVQNLINGLCVAAAAGIYVSLNLLGAGGGRPDSASLVQVVNATLCSVWFFSACFGGTILNLLGPGLTMCIGVQCYVVYVGSLWYFDEVGLEAYPLAAGVIIGIGAGMVFITSGYISLSYPEEDEKGFYVTTVLNMQSTGSMLSGIIPVVINRHADTVAGVPRSVYIAFIAIMALCGFSGLLLRKPQKLKRDDGSTVAVDPARGVWEELSANLLIFKDWKLLAMLPAFLPCETYLVYSGSVNAYHNNLRARSLLSMMAFLIQLPCGYGLQCILDNKRWQRRTRALVGLTVVAVPMIVAWIWEIIRTRNYDRSVPVVRATDWSDPEFGWIFVLFVLTWVSCSLWMYVVMYFIGAITNSPQALTHYNGVFRGFLGAGEAIAFGVDSIGVPFVKEAGVIFAFYLWGICMFYYLGWYHITETNYFKKGEEGVVVPNHILLAGRQPDEEPAAVTVDGKT